MTQKNIATTKKNHKANKLHILLTLRPIPWMIKLVCSVALKAAHRKKLFSGRMVRKLGCDPTAVKRAIAQAQELGLLDDAAQFNPKSEHWIINKRGNPSTFQANSLHHPELDRMAMAIAWFVTSFERAGKRKAMNWTYIGDAIGCDARTAKKHVEKLIDRNLLHAIPKGDRFIFKAGPTPTSKCDEQKSPVPTPSTWKLRLAKCHDWRDVIAYLSEHGVEAAEVTAAGHGLGLPRIEQILLAAAEKHSEGGYQPNLWPLVQDMLKREADKQAAA